jgi:CheY-like chemotaxis protein
MAAKEFLNYLSLGGGDLSSFASLKVLAADDHAYNREVMRCLLELSGAMADIVVDGEELVAAWSIGCYDLILTDVEMPRLNGMAAVAKIRQQERAQGLERIPIIAITTHADTVPEANFKAQGFDMVLPKPISPRKLFSGILHVTWARTMRRESSRENAAERRSFAP